MDGGMDGGRDAGHDGHERPVTYEALGRRSRALAAALQAAGLQRGARVLIALEGTDDYLVAFLGCQYAGMIAVPVFPPESHGRSISSASPRSRAMPARPRCSACAMSSRLARSASFGGIGASERPARCARSAPLMPSATPMA